MLIAAASAALACLLWPAGGDGRGDGPRRPRVAGSRGSWVAWAVVRARRGTDASGAGWVADFAEVVAVGLDAGLDLPAAALASARSPGVVAGAPWLAPHLRACIDAGRGVTTLLEGSPDLGDEARGDLALLVAAWRLAEDVGAAASAVTSSAAASVRERRAAADRTGVVVAGPRASMVLLSALPLAGPAAAVLVGVPPGRLYDSTAARLLGLGGLLLSVVGWWWARGLVRRAGRPGTTGGGSS